MHFGGNTEFFKGLQTLTRLHDSLLYEELDGEMWTEGRMAKDDRGGAEKAAGDRLKRSRGYERGQKFPAICAIVCMCYCVGACTRACAC